MAGTDDDINRDPDERTPDRPLGARHRPTMVPLVLTVLVIAAVMGVLVLLTFVADDNATDG